MTACAQVKANSNDPAHSHIRVFPAATGGGVELALCRQCADPICVMNCPSGALSKDGDTGVIDWAESKCVNCLLCTAGCAYAGIVYEAAVGHVSKCDLCNGDPACVKACSREALEYLTAARIFNAYAEEEDMFCRGLAACHGCNSELLIRHTMRMVGPDAVVAAPETDWNPASAVPPSPASAIAVTSRPTRLYCILTPASMVAVLVKSE